MRGIKKCPTIIYCLRKYRDTGIPRYFLTSSIIDNFLKIPTVRITCSSLTDFIFHIINVNDIICKLSASGRSCHVAGIYVGVLMLLMYAVAGDLLLISST